MTGHDALIERLRVMSDPHGFRYTLEGHRQAHREAADALAALTREREGQLEAIKTVRAMYDEQSARADALYQAVLMGGREQDDLRARAEAAEAALAQAREALDEIDVEVRGQIVDNALAYVETREDLIGPNVPLTQLAATVNEVRRLTRTALAASALGEATDE